jgi:hypothetical protein
MVNLSSMIAKAIAITGMGDQIPWVRGIILKLPRQTADNDSQVFPVSLGLLTPDRDDKNGMREWDCGLPHQRLKNTKFGRYQRHI